MPSSIDPTFTQHVRRIISNSNWNKMYKIIEVLNPSESNVTIKLSKRSELDKYHDEPEYYTNSNKQIRFSITEQAEDIKPRVYIDADNWIFGVAESGLTVEQYRQYVINHEFGHALGHDHLPCKNGVCPVMYQATRGCGTSKCTYTVSDRDLHGLKLNNKYLFAA
jgi:hypothetical protein